MHKQKTTNGGKLGRVWEQGYLFSTWGIYRGLDLAYNSLHKSTVLGQYIY